jgi:hypothetical protein
MCYTVDKKNSFLPDSQCHPSKEQRVNMTQGETREMRKGTKR